MDIRALLNIWRVSLSEDKYQVVGYLWKFTDFKDAEASDWEFTTHRQPFIVGGLRGNIPHLLVKEVYERISTDRT